MIKKNLLLFAAIAVFGTIFSMSLRILPGIQAVEIDIQTDHPDQLKIYYSNSGTFREEDTSAPVPISEQRSKIQVLFTGSFIKYLRIDTGDQAGIAKIYQMKVSSYHHQPLVLGPNEISRLFAAGPDTLMQVFRDHVQVIGAGSDPHFFGKEQLFKPMYWHAGLIALAFAVLVTLILSRLMRQVTGNGSPAKSPSATVVMERLDALDGLRGLAAIMVIADHTCSWFRGVGASGVWIFFALSGFLLARPFISNPQAVLSWTYMSGYFYRRFMRILPMYYTYIFAVYVMSGRLSLAFMHGLFLEGDGHLWALPQEALFYLLWPIVALVLILPLRRYPKITLLMLLIAMVAWNGFVGSEIIWLLGMDHIKLKLFFGVFLAGVFFSFLYSYCSAGACVDSRFNRFARGLASPLGFAVIIVFFLFSTGHIIDKRIVYTHYYYYGSYGFLAGVLIMCILYAKGRVLDNFLNLAPLRELGTVGLSLYLVHPVVKNLIDRFCLTYFDYKLKNFSLFLATLGCSYILARYTFTHIERPGFLEKSGKS
ncbi:MAG: acyltransferase [Pseudomonadota bacterium]